MTLQRLPGGAVILWGREAGFAAALAAFARDRHRLDPDDDLVVRNLIRALSDASAVGSDIGTSEQGTSELGSESPHDEPPWTVTRLAEALDMSTRIVRRWCADGRLQGAYRTNQWLIPAATAETTVALRKGAA